MRVNRWWPDRACVLEVADVGGELFTHRRRYVFRSAAGSVPSVLQAWRESRSGTGGSAVPGPAARSAGWEVRAHDDLLYFLHSGRPRFVMSQAMAPAGYNAIMSRLSGGPAAVRAAAPVASVPALETLPLADQAALADQVPDELAERRGARRAWAAFMTPRAFPELPTVVAASFVVLALALITAMLAAPQSVDRAVPVAHGPATPTVTVGAHANAQPAGRGEVAAGAPILHPGAAPASGLSQAAPRASYVGSSARVTAARPTLQFAVVSGSLPRAVALRRVIALVASGLAQTPRVMAVSATRAVLYYGGSNSRAAAQALAARVRTLGYTAAVVTE